MAFRVIFDRSAIEDLHDIFDYLVERSPKGAENVLRDIRTSIDLVAAWPRLGKASRNRSSRLLITGKYRYRVLYEVGEDVVTIRQIVHSSRNLP